jgi:hypothetical protein
MPRKASTRERQTDMASKKLVMGQDFTPPGPITSVLPRIQLTLSQADELWAIVCKARRRSPNNDDDAEIAKEIFEAQNFENAVQWAIRFYIHDITYLSDVPQLRRSLKTLQNDVAWFLNALPQEHDPVGYFLKRTYTREVFLKDSLRSTDEERAQSEQAWSTEHGLAAIRNNLAGLQTSIDNASSLVSGTKPRDVPVGNFVASLAHAWQLATGNWPKSGRDPHNESRQSGPFADCVRAAIEMLPAKYRPENVDHVIRSVCARR